jgi:hypothetical protein
MRTTGTITASLAAILVAAAVAGPAAALPADAAHQQPNPWYAGESAIQGSLPSDSSNDPATANVYVPPSELAPSDHITPHAAPPTWPANPQPLAAVDVPSSGFDWSSAGIGVAAGIGAFAIVLAGTAGMRRRRVARPPSVATP